MITKKTFIMHSSRAFLQVPDSRFRSKIYEALHREKSETDFEEGKIS